jgi:hypothetical protein
MTVLADVPQQTGARLSFRQPVSGAGFVDAAWWPHSQDLVAELPALLDVFWTAGREIVRVSYSMEFWGPQPRQVLIHGRTVKLGGHRVQSPLLIALLDSWGREYVDVLVVAPQTAPEVAARALEIASRPGGTERPDEIMAGAQQG